MAQVRQGSGDGGEVEPGDVRTILGHAGKHSRMTQRSGGQFVTEGLTADARGPLTYRSAAVRSHGRLGEAQVQQGRRAGDGGRVCVETGDR